MIELLSHLTPLQGIVLGFSVAVWLGLVIWLIVSTWRDERDPEEHLYRTNQGRRMPPRSPARKKRGW